MILQGSPCLHFPSAEAAHTPGFFTWVLGGWPEVLMFAWQVLHWLSHLPIPNLTLCGHPWVLDNCPSFQADPPPRKDIAWCNSGPQVRPWECGASKGATWKARMFCSEKTLSFRYSPGIVSTAMLLAIQSAQKFPPTLTIYQNYIENHCGLGDESASMLSSLWKEAATSKIPRSPTKKKNELKCGHITQKP